MGRLSFVLLTVTSAGSAVAAVPVFSILVGAVLLELQFRRGIYIMGAFFLTEKSAQ